MTDYDNIYRNAYENLNQYEEELREAFQRRADKKGRINTEDIVDLIDDVSVLFAFDCERSKFFFSQENRNIPQGFNINALSFDEFFELFGLWLLQEADGYGQESDREESPDYSNVDNNRYSTNQRDTANEEMDEENGISPNYEHNKKIMDELFKQHKAEYRGIFNDRLFEEGQKKIHMQDCFIVLQDCFYIDLVDLKERADDQADFFQSINSYKRLFKIAERYFIDEKGADPSDFDVREAMMGFDDCFDFLDYWFKTDHHVILVDHRGVAGEVGEGGVKKVLEDTIAKYEKMVKDTSNQMEKQILEGTIETLKKKLMELEKGEGKGKNRRSEETDEQKREERKNRALKEIFEFYCSQQLNVGRSATFAKLDRLANTITLGTFKVLLKSFRLKIEHHKLIELYNKSAGQDDNLGYEEFINLMYKVAMRVEIAPEAKVHQPNPDIMKEYKPTSYKSDPTYRVFKQNEARKKEDAQYVKKKNKPVYHDQTKRDAERVEEIWEHMGLYNGQYKSIMGFFNLPFNSQDKQDFRIAVGSLKYKYKEHENEGKTPQEMQQELQKRNELRQLVKDLKSMEKGVLTKFRGSSSPVRHDIPENGNTYIQKRSHKIKQSGSLPTKKLTMKKLENLNHKEVKAPDDRFNPYDLIDENDDDDNMYLAEYNIQHERHEARSHGEVERKKIDEYGRLKKASKGIAVNGRYGSGTPEVTHPKMGYDQHPNAKPYMHPGQGVPTGHSYESSPRNLPYSVRNNKIPLGHQPSYLEYEGGYRSKSPVAHGQYVGSPANSMGHVSGYSGYSGYNASEPYVRNNGYYMNNKSPAYGSAIERAGQVEVDARRREQQMINNIMSMQSNQLKKGLKIAGK